MKKLLLILLCLPFIGFGQSVPQGINYQAVARDANGNVLMNQALTIQFSIISDITTSAVSWQETHTVSTNDYGLYTAIIGQGIATSVGSSATFDVIDWGASNHLLKVEVDFGGGLVDMGTTAFMSVPYSLYSDRAGPPGPAGPQGIQGLTGQDGAVGPQGPIGLTGPQGNTGATGVDGQGGVTNAGAGISITGAGTSVNPYVVSTSTCGLSIGDTHQGGIIFYLDPSGCSGLVCAPTDQSSGIPWSHNNWIVPIGAYESGLMTGSYNTSRINLFVHPDGNTPSNNASKICATYSGGGYNDWYLPSIEELKYMYINLHLQGLGGFVNLNYWSSTEFDDNNALLKAFFSGQNWIWNKNAYLYVRAVRAFY